MSVIQNDFDSAVGDFKLAPGEYEGPLVISRPCVIDGGNATLWAQEGPVLSIESAGVTIQNLRIEIAGTPSEEGSKTAVQSSAGDTVFKNVEVKGDVSGVAGEQDSWSAPSMISLGEFAANKPNSFTYELTVPVKAKLECRMKDVEISPTSLSPGKNTLLIKTANMRDNTILYGEIILKTAVNRRIYLLGRAKKGAAEHNELLPVQDTSPVSEPVQITPPEIIVAPAVQDDQNSQPLNRGQRVSAAEMEKGIVKVVFEQADESQNEDIDPYVFRLRNNGKVSSDEDLVFFGNPEPARGDVKVVTDSVQTMAIFELSRAEAETDRYVVCFSFYEESGNNFSTVAKPLVRIIFNAKEVYRFVLDDLSKEKTVVAVEFYRYKGSWKISAVGRGYQSGLTKLCESYGVNVE